MSGDDSNSLLIEGRLVLPTSMSSLHASSRRLFQTSVVIEKPPEKVGQKSTSRTLSCISIYQAALESISHLHLHNSTLIPPTGFSSSEDRDTTPGFVSTEYDLDLRVLRGCYEGLKPPNKV